MQIELEPITNADYNNIKRLTSDINTMQYVYNSKVWTRENIQKFLANCKYYAGLPDDKRDVYSYRISITVCTGIITQCNGTGVPRNSIKPGSRRTFAGIIEFKTLKYYSKFKIYEDIKHKLKSACILTILILPEYHNKGIFGKVLPLLKDKIKHHKPDAKYIASLVMESNTKMQYVMDKYKFKLVGQARGLLETNYIYKSKLET